MAEYNNVTRAKLAQNRVEERNVKIRHLPEQEQALVKELTTRGAFGNAVNESVNAFLKQEGGTPSQWFQEKAFVSALLPEEYRVSFFYIIDKLNRFPFTSGWQRRAVRSADYKLCIRQAFSVLKAFDNFAWSNASVEDFLYNRLSEETADYIQHTWSYRSDFNYLYAAEIDRGNQKVIDALKDLILSENNTAYLDREMILGIIRSDNAELHTLLGDFLLAARLQEGVRQSICEAMDEGTTQAFFVLFDVIEKNNQNAISDVSSKFLIWFGKMFGDFICKS